MDTEVLPAVKNSYIFLALTGGSLAVPVLLVREPQP
jgi:hypothetical protein